MKALKNFRALGLLLLTLIAFNATAQTAEIRGSVTDFKTGKPVQDIVVTMQYKGEIKTEFTDEKGEYSFKPIEAGTYTLNMTKLGYNPMQIKDITVGPNSLIILDKTMEAGVNLGPVDVISYKDNIDIKKPEGEYTIKIDPIHPPAVNRDMGSIMTAYVPGAVSTGRNDDKISIRGGRPDATLYYIDGVKVYGEPYVPFSGVESVTVITGGVPAQYGDTTSGVVLITTRSFQ